MTAAIDRKTLWRRQVWTLAVHEWRRAVFGKRSLGVWMLASLPIMVAVLRALFLPESQQNAPAVAVGEFTDIFHIFILRFVVFFSCAFLFVKLFRGEILERSFHYPLLAPLRREVLVVGKYLGGVAAVVTILVPATLLTYSLIFLPHGVDALLRHLSVAGGFGHVLSYCAVIVLACMGYGAVFMLAGLFFKNPMVPAILLLGWEIATPFLPPFLKALSLVHYLSSLTPLPLTHGPFALVAQPVATWLAVLALVGLGVVLLALSSWKARRLEITYASE